MMFSAKPLSAKNKALIISDSVATASKIETEFSHAGWSIESASTYLMMRQGSFSARNYHCVLLVIDANFRKRFGSIIVEMGAIIRNYSMHTPLYLMFEDDYYPCFSSWQHYAKRLFKSAMYQQNLWDAIQKIVRLESESVPGTPFILPKNPNALAQLRP